MQLPTSDSHWSQQDLSALMQRVIVSTQSLTVLKAFALYTLSAWRAKQGTHAKLITHQEVDEREGSHLIIDPQFVFCEFWNNFMGVWFGLPLCLFFQGRKFLNWSSTNKTEWNNDKSSALITITAEKYLPRKKDGNGIKNKASLFSDKILLPSHFYKLTFLNTFCFMNKCVYSIPAYSVKNYRFLFSLSFMQKSNHIPQCKVHLSILLSPSNSPS